jgi:uncharacterized protein YihD (DUF1040 family)
MEKFEAKCIEENIVVKVTKASDYTYSEYYKINVFSLCSLLNFLKKKNKEDWFVVNLNDNKDDICDYDIKVVIYDAHIE